VDSIEELPEGILGDAQIALRRDLEARGFVTLQERFDRKSFGNCIVDLTTESLTVRIARDRLVWELSASVPGWKEWFPVAMWRWVYEGGVLPGGDSDFQEDATWLVASLDQILDDLKTNRDHLNQRLWECGRARLAARFERGRERPND
jgi:hypothetical protein